MSIRKDLNRGSRSSEQPTEKADEQHDIRLQNNEEKRWVCSVLVDTNITVILVSVSVGFVSNER
jgi:hypothetical protein